MLSPFFDPDPENWSKLNDRKFGQASLNRLRRISAMKTSKFTPEQITFALKQAETGTSVSEVCRKMGFSGQTFYRRKRAYGGLGSSELRRLRQLEAEIRKVKHLMPDLSVDKIMLQDVLSKKLECLNANGFLSLEDARRKIAAWRPEYNESRPHISLGFRTPSKFALVQSASVGL